MDSSTRTRMIVRILVMVTVAAVLAFVPILFLEQPITSVFSPLPQAQKLAKEFIRLEKSCHIWGIVALFAVNLIFFIVNQKKSDFGSSLQRRISLQQWCNVIVILAVLCIMIVLRYKLRAESFILLGFLANDLTILLYAWLPYYIFVISGVLLWSCCIRVTPATNCYVRSPLARVIDNAISRKSDNDA